jgi:hypothetical protein
LITIGIVFAYSYILPSIIKKKYKKQKKRIMKNNVIIKTIKWGMAISMAFLLYSYIYAAPPPPPGVPLDGGISFLIISAVGYGAHKISKEQT